MIHSEKLTWLRKTASWFFYRLQITKEVAIFIACQFALESDFGNSRFARENQNFCGMKSPINRISTNLNPQRSFASYSCFEDCCLDYCLWLSFNRCTVGKLAYLDYFKVFLREKNYCPEKDYIDRIQKIFDSFNCDELFNL